MLFRKDPMDDWFKLMSQSYSNPPVRYKGAVMPAFPSDQIQAGTTGQSGIATLNEAFVFYKHCVNTFESLGSPIRHDHQVLDFGSGWGRIARFFLQDVPLSNIHGLDVTPGFTDICRETFGSPNFHTCEPFPPTELKDGRFNFIVAYSVFSHLSESACTAWMKEFSRMLAPGGIVAVTTRGRQFFDFCERQKTPEMRIVAGMEGEQGEVKSVSYRESLGLLFDDFDAARDQYDRGEFVHSNIEGVGGGGALNTTFYGESFIPESYARDAYQDDFQLEKFLYNPTRFVYKPRTISHPILFFRKH